jgi:hypothetical protein
VRSLETPTEWFLIDWEHASFFPTSAMGETFNPNTHCPAVFEPNHGCEVDIWAVGKLLNSAKRSKKVLELGEMMMNDTSLGATRALDMVLELQN